MATLVYKVATWHNPLAVLPVLLLAGALWIGMERTPYQSLNILEKPLFLVLILQVVLFLFLIKRPVWAVASLVVGQLTSSGYMLSVGSNLISARFLWTVLAMLLLLPLLARRWATMDRAANLVLFPALAFFALTILANWVNTDTGYTIKYLRQTLTSLIILLVVPAAILAKKDIKILAVVTVLTAFASAVVAVMQHYSFRGLPVFVIRLEALWPGRMPGLTEGPVEIRLPGQRMM